MELHAIIITPARTKQFRAQGTAQDIAPIIEAIDYKITHCMASYCIEITSDNITIEATNEETTISNKNESRQVNESILTAFNKLSAYMK